MPVAASLYCRWEHDPMLPALQVVQHEMFAKQYCRATSQCSVSASNHSLPQKAYHVSAGSPLCTRWAHWQQREAAVIPTGSEGNRGFAADCCDIKWHLQPGGSSSLLWYSPPSYMFESPELVRNQWKRTWFWFRSTSNSVFHYFPQHKAKEKWTKHCM